MKKILLSLCLFVAATATQSFAANNNTAAQEPATTSINDNDLKGNKRFTVQVSTGEGGQIEIMGTGAISKNSVASATINTGEDVQLVITADEGYVLKTLYVDGADVLADVSEDGIYTITAISKNMSVSATFEEKPKTTGDVNGDGVVNSADAVAVFNAVSGEGPTDGADVNGDGVINSADAVAVYNLIAGGE
ncbi:MAG: dockerin type I domain-containing protein [Bacteroidaceae bacterium]